MVNKMGGSVKWTGQRLLRTKLTAIRFLQGGQKHLMKGSKKKKKKQPHWLQFIAPVCGVWIIKWLALSKKSTWVAQIKAPSNNHEQSGSRVAKSKHYFFFYPVNFVIFN